MPPRQSPPKLATCETTAAITLHVRVVGDRPFNPSGHTTPRPRALCGVNIAWDTQIDLGGVRCRSCLQALELTMRWTGPRARDLKPDGVTLRWSVPAERWPYGPPSHHQECCSLFPRSSKDARGAQPGGQFCDCAASAADDDEYGEGSYTAGHPDTPTGPGRGPR